MPSILAATGLLASAACQPVDPLPDAGCEDLPACRENTLLSCGADGGVAETPCEGARCAADAPTPRCVPVEALPCDPGVPSTCRNGLLFGCDPEVGYLLATRCPEGELCVGDGCRGLQRIPCDPATWSVLCVEGDTYPCVDGHPAQEVGGCD